MPLSVSPSIPSVRNLRWSSGLVLWIYVVLHLANHALGLVSLDAAEGMRGVLYVLWHSVLGAVLLYGALTAHLAMAAVAVWQRRALRMPAMEALRLGLGLCLPLLLAEHGVSTYWADVAWDVEPSYTRIVPAIWSPYYITLQLLLLTAAWTHGCLGLHLALRRHAWWERWQPLLLTAAVLLPVLAALGVLSMMREIAAISMSLPAGPTPQAAQALRGLTDWLRGGWLLVLAAVLALRWAWDYVRQRQAGGAIALRYPDRVVQVSRGFSVLEASRAHGVAHLSLCGGRGRCSTCRVHVKGPAEHLPPPGRDESMTLKRVHAPADVRLACQLRPTGDVAVTPLLHAVAGGAVTRQDARRHGREHQVAILFVDLRRWSGLAERQWPFDLAWVLDQYFARVGAAVEQCGGLANQFIGDSVMAIFGLHTNLSTACCQAVRAAALIEQRLDAWGENFSVQFGQPLDFGMGLHAGRVAVGDVGYGETTTFTAVGEVVNTASRLQDYSKVAQTRLVLSLDAAHLAGVADALGSPEPVQVRGRSAPLQVLHVPRPSELWGE